MVTTSESVSGEQVFQPGEALRSLPLLTPYTMAEVVDRKLLIQVMSLSNKSVTIETSSYLGCVQEPNEVLDNSAAQEQANLVHSASAESSGIGTWEDIHTKEEVFAAMPAHLLQMFESSLEHLNKEQTVQFGKLLLEFEDIFAHNDTDLGLFTAVEHSVDTGDVRPIKQGLQKQPQGFEGEEEGHLQKMVEVGVVEPSSSPWSSPSVLVRKKDGSLWWCIDFRKINSEQKGCLPPSPNRGLCGCLGRD